MAFEQDLRAYLEARDRESRGDGSLPRRQVDVTELHAHLLHRLRSMEGSGTVDSVARLFHEWSSDKSDKLRRFALHLETLPKAMAPVDRAELAMFARRALDVAIEYPDPGRSLVDQLEMKRIAAEFVDENTAVASYSLQNQLVRRSDRRRSRMTELGRVFLRLHGKDAVRWLVTIETLLSTGSFDPWHVSSDLLRRAASLEGVQLHFGHETPTPRIETLNRLISLGLLEDLEPDEPDLGWYRVPASMHDTVQFLLEPGPWHAAIRGLIDDEHAFWVPEVASGVTEANVEQTKLIAHEVRK